MASTAATSWSHSRSSTFERCLRRYWFNYFGRNKTVWKDLAAAGDAAGGGDAAEFPLLQSRLRLLGSLSSLPMTAGTVVHSTLESGIRAFQEDSEARPTSDVLMPMAKEHYATLLRSAISRAGVRSPRSRIPLLAEIYYPPHEIAWPMRSLHWGTVRKCVDNFGRAAASGDGIVGEMLADDSRIVSLERRESLRIADPDADEASHFHLDFAMDVAYERANGDLVIVDWKSGKAYEDHKDQLALYGLLAHEMYGREPESIVVVGAYLKQNEFTELRCSKDLLDDARARVIASARTMVEQDKQRMRVEAYPHTDRRGDCKSCAFRQICTAVDFDPDATVADMERALTEETNRVDALEAADLALLVQRIPMHADRVLLDATRQPVSPFMPA